MAGAAHEDEGRRLVGTARVISRGSRLDEGREGKHGGEAKAGENGDDEEKPEQSGHGSLLKRYSARTMQGPRRQALPMRLSFAGTGGSNALVTEPPRPC